jgi:hypothetical protein
LFQERVRTAAAAAFHGQTLLDGRLYLRLTYFHQEPTSQDVDNMIKRILDALKGTVFADDFDVTQCLAQRIYIPYGFTIAEQHPSARVMQELISLIDQKVPHFTYVEIGQAASQVLSFGQIGE